MLLLLDVRDCFMTNARPRSRKNLYGTITENLEDNSKEEVIKTINTLKIFQRPDVTQLNIILVVGGSKEPKNKLTKIKACKVSIRRHKRTRKKYYGSKSSSNNKTKSKKKKYFAGFSNNKYSSYNYWFKRKKEDSEKN